MSTVICLVRHGVTRWNYDGKAQGTADLPLSPEGIRQAELVAAHLSMDRWDAIYSSPLRRAYDTAQAIARRTGHSQIDSDPRLMERHMGEAEGSTLGDRPFRWPGLDWNEIPGLEPDADLVARSHTALREIAVRHPDGRVLCVSHGALIATFLRSLVPPGATPLGGHQRNTAFTLVGFDSDRFTQLGPPNFDHLLINGVECSGEKGRVQASHLVELGATRLPTATLNALVQNATAIEAAWSGDRVLAFLRGFTDSVLHGYIDLVLSRPGSEHLVPLLVKRMEDRFPEVLFQVLPRPAQERTSD